MWSVMNVFNTTAGKHKRYNFQDPVKSTDNWKLEYLLNFKNFIKVWKDSQIRKTNVIIFKLGWKT